ncbi:serine protease nudel [Penaeus vannamei]|uniref:serine protease nudel n=1 Tax=Penaeus vannamei TaxID=6689 RepID=UPI00387F9780
MALQQFRDMKIVRFIYLLLLQILMVSSLHSPAVALNLGKFQTMIGSLSIEACNFPPGVKYRCDEEFDCLDFADERGCGACRGKELACTKNSKPICLPDNRVCDGVRDCDDGKDEHLCYRLISDMNNYKEHERIQRNGYVQFKRNNKWHMLCFDKFSHFSDLSHHNYLSDVCKDIAGSSRCGRENVRIVNVKWRPALTKFTFVIRKPGGNIVEVPSCPTYLIGYLNCAEPCGHYRRTRRHAGDAPSGTNSSFGAAVPPPASPLPPPQLQDEEQDDDSYWEQLSQRFLKQEQEQRHMDSRIVGGTNADRKTWPFIVSLSYRGSHFCGGSIITAEWVLSAAHCLYELRRRLRKTVIEVQAGMFRRLSWSPYEQTSTVSHVVFHPGYNKYSSDNDIMVIKIATPFQFNRWVRPIALAQKDDVVDKMCSVAGWGTTTEGGRIPNELQEVNVPLHRQCPRVYKVPNAHFLCAGYRHGGKDSCQGDSGGPMMCNSVKKGWELYGVVSFGIGCARRGYPGAYTKVPFYYRWIKLAMRSWNMISAKQTCARKCWRNLGSCLQSSRCRSLNDCWDLKMRCYSRSLNISTTDPPIHESSALSPVVKAQFTKPCPEGMSPCFATNECFFPNQRCDREINCGDLSDELNCTCLMRTANEYLCDGYPDCPDFSDERHCVNNDKGCSEGERWCMQAGTPTCVNKDKQCDGVQDCDDKSDEHLCMRLVSNAHDSSDPFVVKRSGFLQMRRMGHWLPFCSSPIQSYAALVSSVCSDIVGHENNDTHIFQLKPIQTPSELKSKTWTRLSFHNSSYTMANTCDSNLGLLIACAEPKCGSQYAYHVRHKRAQFGLLHGSKYFLGLGSRAGLANSMATSNAEPEMWGFLVMLLREGLPTCLGSILDSRWILTAAACVDEYDQYFYEVKAGMLRRNSTSPYEQISNVTEIINNEHELALLRLATPLHLNRWVRPVCEFDSEVVDVNTDCVIAGWTNMQEEEPYDHLQQSTLKTLSCPSVNKDSQLCVDGDRTEKTLPGTPLMCRRGEEWHLGGVSSGGSTVENRNGVFTRISSFRQWIENRQSYVDRNRSNSTRGLRPGCALGTCVSSLGTCQTVVGHCNSQVDCLDLKDESQCVLTLTPSLQEQETSGSNGLPVQGRNPVEAAVAQLLSGLSKPVGDSSISEEQSSDVVVANASEPLCKGDDFRCQLIPECIPIRERCDGTPQCRDQSDEHRCSCLDRLRSVKPGLVNDGYYDCFDGSDEFVKLCQGFMCETSRQCIAMSEACDGVVDCQYAEDEINCIGLVSAVDPPSLSGLLDLSEQRSPAGMLMRKEGISWRPVCLEGVSTELVKEICPYLGYSSDPIETSHNTSDPIEILYEEETRRLRANQSVVNFPAKLGDELPYWREDAAAPHQGDVGQQGRHGFLKLLQVIQKDGSEGRCKSEVRCGEELCGIVPRFVFTQDIPVWKLGGVPWAGAVYVNGQYKCGATIVQPSWVMTSVACISQVDLTKSRVTVVMGSWRKVGKPTRLWSAYEHDRRVDYKVAVTSSDIMLLHLQERMPKSHYINHLCLPNSLPKVQPNSSCVIAGLSEDDDRLSLGIAFHTDENCTNSEICIADDLGKAPCMSSWAGVIACRTGSGANSVWTGVGMWSHGKHDGNSSQPVRHSLFTNEDLNSIFRILATPDTSIPTVPDICEGDACATGVCIGQEMKCDMKLDCPDLADELPTCPTHFSLCAPDKETDTCVCEDEMMQCPDKICIPFDKVCDGISHCLDGSDEVNCTCIEMLRRVDRRKVCDGIIDCEDQDDEKYCGCSDHSKFRCYNSSQMCIEEELMCDGKSDCENGEDENHCLALSPWVFVSETVLGIPQRSREGFLMLRMRGRWFTYGSKHWSKNTYLSGHLCQNLGYPNVIATVSRSLSMEQVIEIGKEFANSTNADLTKFDTSRLLPSEEEDSTSVVYVVCLEED